jgi:transposase InsO family protein
MHVVGRDSGGSLNCLRRNRSDSSMYRAVSASSDVLDFIRPGKPVENGYIESFNGKLRDGVSERGGLLHPGRRSA